MNELTTLLIQGVIVPLLAIWIAGFGTCYIIGKHGTYLSLSRRYLVNPVKGAFMRFLNRYKKELILLAVGIALGIWIALQFSTASY